jgi:hypothetical protein
VIETIPHDQQRYDTVGDWYLGADATWHIKVSAMDDWRHEALVAIHELAEMAMCLQDGVSQSVVDDFDKAFEEHRPAGSTAEPGDCVDAPYAVQHGIASGIERAVATVLGVDWNVYNDEVNAL